MVSLNLNSYHYRMRNKIEKIFVFILIPILLGLSGAYVYDANYCSIWSESAYVGYKIFSCQELEVMKNSPEPQNIEKIIRTKLIKLMRNNGFSDFVEIPYEQWNWMLSITDDWYNLNYEIKEDDDIDKYIQSLDLNEKIHQWIIISMKEKN